MSSFVNWKNCRRFALWLTFWAMATAAGGCVERVTAPIVSTSVGRDLESFAEFKDVPYPANMVFNKDESFTYRR
ncbi:MAG: hypothetical protein LBS31_03785, partial [Candidatus Adiutrix sp.]|nr:hypothetical protein [Candidatus Adiutrix sp.]